MSLIQKQQWGSLVLNRHAERGPERKGETPADFVAEIVQEKRPGAPDSDHRRAHPPRAVVGGHAGGSREAEARYLNMNDEF